VRLTDDQRALLKLLLEQGHSYDDIASLLGIEADEARERARAALAEMAGEDPDAEVAVTDYLLGQADSIARADVERHLSADPAAREVATKLETQLRLLAPTASLGQPDKGSSSPPSRKPAARPDPPQKAARVKAPTPDKPKRPTAPKLKLPQAPSLPSSLDRRLAAAVGGGLLLVVLAVLLASGAFGGGDEGGDEATGDTGGQRETAAGGGAQQPTRAVLRPVGDQGDAQGDALFGRTQNTPAIRVQASGLEPSPPEGSYMLWLYRSPSLALRFGRVSVGQDGRLAVQVAIPAEALTLVAAGTFDSIDVSLAADAAYRAEQQRANRAEQPPRYVGESVLRGPIAGPLVRQAASGGG